MRVQVLQALERLRGLGVTPNVDDVQRRMSSGKPSNEIFSAADGIQPDMIVMGSPTSNAFKKLVTHAPCTLVLVKDKGAE